MEHKAGEAEVQIFMGVFGERTEVVSAKQAAIITGYSRTHMCRLCDEGTVRAYKVSGVWWVEVSQLVNVGKDS